MRRLQLDQARSDRHSAHLRRSKAKRSAIDSTPNQCSKILADRRRSQNAPTVPCKVDQCSLLTKINSLLRCVGNLHATLCYYKWYSDHFSPTRPQSKKIPCRFPVSREICPWRPVCRDCLHHQQVLENQRAFLRVSLGPHSRGLAPVGSVCVRYSARFAGARGQN